MAVYKQQEFLIRKTRGENFTDRKALNVVLRKTYEQIALVGIKGRGTAAGTGTYTVTLDDADISSFAKFDQILVQFTSTNAGANPTINPNSTGDVLLKKDGAYNLSPADINANQIYTLTKDDNFWQINI